MDDDSGAEAAVGAEVTDSILEQTKQSAIGANRSDSHSNIPVALRSNSDVVSFTSYLHRYTKTLQLKLDAERNKAVVPQTWRLSSRFFHPGIYRKHQALAQLLLTLL